MVILDEVLYFTVLYPLQTLQLSACAHSNFRASTMCPVLQAVLIYMSLQYSYVNIIWTCTCIGGLGFSLKEIGISLTVAGVLMLPMTMCAFPLVR